MHIITVCQIPNLMYDVHTYIVATERMKFASEARASQYIVPFGNTEPFVCHYLDTLRTLRVGS